MTWQKRCTASQPTGTSESSAPGPIPCCLTPKIHLIASSARTTFSSSISALSLRSTKRTLAAPSSSAQIPRSSSCATMWPVHSPMASVTSRKIPAITASQLYAHAVSLAEKYGWEFGGRIARHLIGQFPHERIAEDKITLYIHPRSNLLMRSTDDQGRLRHWILEIHFVDRNRQIGGFFEELLTVG